MVEYAVIINIDSKTKERLDRRGLLNLTAFSSPLTTIYSLGPPAKDVIERALADYARGEDEIKVGGTD